AALGLAAATLAGNSVYALTSTWSGAVSSEIGSNLNWSGSVLPGATNDTMQWNGSVAGNLSLIYSNGVLGGGAGNAGVNLLLTAGQTGSLNIDATTNGALRLNNITVASGAGTFSLG